GSLAMLAFLTFFRFGCPSLGLGWGTVCGYLAALLVLGATGSASGPLRVEGGPVLNLRWKHSSTGPARDTWRTAQEREGRLRMDPAGRRTGGPRTVRVPVRRHSRRRRFSPRLE